MTTFILDSRNQKDSFVEKALNDLGHKTSRDFKLSFGDVAKSTNVFNTIDLKSSGGGLIELAKNVCSKDHNRLKMEILKASGECSDAAEGSVVRLKDAFPSRWRRGWRQCPLGHGWKAAAFSRAGPP